MTRPEQRPTAAEEPRPEPGRVQPLYLRLYFRAHLTDVVRAFGYHELPLAEARRRVQPLIATYGEAPVMAACRELLEPCADGTAWRLTERVRKLAVALLGHPPQATAGPTETPPDAVPPPAAAGPSANDAASAKDTPPVPRPRVPGPRSPRSPRKRRGPSTEPPKTSS